MTYEKKTITVDGKEHEVIHCLGHGQCQCSKCKEEGRYYVSWTNWFYKLTEDSPAVCYDCIKKLLRGKQDGTNID